MIIVIKRTVGEKQFTGFDIVTTRVVLNAQPVQSCALPVCVFVCLCVCVFVCLCVCVFVCL